MYVDPNYQTKKALKEAVARGELVFAFSPGPFATSFIQGQIVSIEGPHYPKPHAWYATVEVDHNGNVTRVTG